MLTSDKEQDTQDLLRCVNFRIRELQYALESRNPRCLESLRLTGCEARDEVDRLVSLLARLEPGG